MRRLLSATTAALALVLSGCGAATGGGAAAPPVNGPATHAGTTAYDAALSKPVEDSVYPDVGDPSVDALHYNLDLTWDPTHEVLTGTETLLFRAAQTGKSFQLDLAHQLTVGTVWLDGKTVPFTHQAKDLIVHQAVTAGDRHVLQLTYSGTPEPVPAPTDRPDFSATGWTTTSDGSVWTMQEPYGAYSWYAVNDQPADKAFYDFRINAPSDMVGVANGRLRSRHEAGGRTVTRWRLPEPASSYLVTIAIGHYTETKDTGPHGLPITYWTPSDRPKLIQKLSYAPKALAYLEHKVGRYPFPTLGLLVVPSDSAMETQSMLTLGNHSYDLSHDVIVHELGHQWYGDEVSPGDWSDLWMNEGMATYLAEANWTGDHGPKSRTALLRHWTTFVAGMRAQFGPPAHYKPESFAEGNAYYIPALMWDTIRQRLGDRAFWKVAGEWPKAHRFTSQDRDVVAAWWSKKAGQNLKPVFHRWLLGPNEPTWHAG